MLDQVPADLRLAARRLSKAPAASLTVVTALAIGIGLCALLVAIIDGAILSSLPFDGGDRIVRIARADGSPVSAETYLHWVERHRSFEGLGIATQRTATLGADGLATEPVAAAAMTPSTFELLSAEPRLGRRFTDADAAPGAPPVVLLGDRLWRTRFSADPDITGRTVRLSGVPFEVIGVMPAGFGFPFFQEAWTPQSLDALRPDRNPESFVVFGLLREGVAPAAAALELESLERERPGSGADAARAPIEVVAYTNVINPAAMTYVIAGVMLGVALLVLLVACANVTNVLLARAAARSREIAVRTALGASRGRIAMQFWTEVALLALAGACGGAVLAELGIHATRDAVSTVGVPFWWDLRLDLTVLAFISIAAVLVACAAGVAPALFASRTQSFEHLKEASRATSSIGTSRMMRRLIAVEIGVSLVLLVAAGLFIRSAINVRTFEFTFAPEGIYLARVTPAEDRYPTVASRTALAGRLEEALAALPEAEDIAIATSLPGTGAGRRPFAIEGTEPIAEPDLPDAAYVVATPGYFPTLQTRARTGREFDDGDREDTLPIAVVSASFERLYLPRGALGQRIALADESEEPPWRTIVGVVPDLPIGELNAPTQEAVYVPFAQAAPTQFFVAVRSRTTAEQLATPIRATVTAVDPDAALSFMRPLDDAIESANAGFRWFGALFVVSGALALALAAVGLYGVMAFWVAQRTREIGLRMAIGGGRRRIVGLVLRRGMTPVLAGLCGGLVAALPLAWLLRSMLLEVSWLDPLVFGGVVTVLLAAAWLGCLAPAIHATRIDPQVALTMD